MKRSCRLVLILFVLSSSLSAAQAFQNEKQVISAPLAGNRLRNPGFEVFTGTAGVADYWHIHQGHDATVARSTDARAGSYCQRIDIGTILPAGNSVVIHQSQDYVQLQGNRTYQFSFWARGRGQIVPSIILNGFTYIKWGKITALEDAWRLFQYTFTTPDKVWEINELIRYDDNINFPGAISSDDWLLIDDASLIGPLVDVERVMVHPIITLPGNAVTITAQINDAGAGIGSVIAEIESPDEIHQATLALLDDGLHGDGAAGDNIFGNSWTTLATPMDYFLDLLVTNASQDTFTFNNVSIFSTQNSSLPTQSTHDPGYDNSGSLLQTDDGAVWLFWCSSREGRTKIWYKKSFDSGLSWSEESRLEASMSSYSPSATQSADGRIWVFYDDYADIWLVTSNDSGKTWSAPQQFTTNPAIEAFANVAADKAGRIAVVWNSNPSGNWDVFYRLSTDNGATWTDVVQMSDDPNADQEPTVAMDHQGGIYMAWSRANMYDIVYTKSDDSGVTWQPLRALTFDFQKRAGHPAIDVDRSGRIWAVFTGVEYYEQGKTDYNWDIYFTVSDDGNNWQPIYRLTQFSGYDIYSDVAMINDQPRVVWDSDRAGNRDIWAGVLGMTQDINPPPYVNYVEHFPASPFPGPDDLITITANAADETGIARVHLIHSVNNQAIQREIMFDDGNHQDRGSGDGRFGIQIGPYPAGTIVTYQIEAQDVDGNSFLAPQTPVQIDIIEPFSKRASILLLADYKYNYSNLLSYYIDALDANAYTYDIWDCYRRGAPADSVLLRYTDGAVIWFMPYSGYIAEPTVQAMLKKYLDAGGKLFITGQNIGNSIKNSNFLTDYLHARFVQTNSGLFSLRGIESEPMTQGMSLVISGTDGANNQYSPDEIDPIAPAVTILEYFSTAAALTMPTRIENFAAGYQKAAFQAEPFSEIPPDILAEAIDGSLSPHATLSSGAAAIKVASANYRVVYFAFGFEGIVDSTNRALLMHRVLDWLLSPDVGVESDEGSALPTVYALDQNYPNPFNPTTTIHYQLPQATEIKLEIFNLRGQRVATLVDRRQAAGYYAVIWDGKDDLGHPVTSGVYIFRLESREFIKVRKLVLIR